MSTIHFKKNSLNRTPPSLSHSPPWMALFKIIMNLKLFIATIFTFFTSLSQRPDPPTLLPTTTISPPPPAPPPSMATKLRLLLTSMYNNDEVRRINNWPKLVIAFCTATAPNMAVQFLQSAHSSETVLPITFQLLMLAVTIAFACIFVATYVCKKCPNMAEFLANCGVFFGATAFFLAASIPLSFIVFKFVILIVYALSILIIVLCIYYVA